MSPIPTPVLNAIIKNYRKIHQQGDIQWAEDMKKYRDLCGEIATMINTDRDNVCFVQNTSTAMSLIALSLHSTIKTPCNPGFSLLSSRYPGHAYRRPHLLPP